jgi:RNA methyltransferase, TrmH family
MLSKVKIQFITSLFQKKFRKTTGLFVVEGEKSVSELLQSNLVIEEVYSVASWKNDNQLIAAQLMDRYTEVNDYELKKISSLVNPNKVLAVAKIPEAEINLDEIGEQLVFVLDEINDPGNLGTIIRLAEWFGVKNIICGDRTTDAYGPKTVQAAMGSLFRINIVYDNLGNWISGYKMVTENTVYAATLDGEDLYSAELKKKGLLIIGSEAHGVSKFLLPQVDVQLKIPTYNKELKSAESLNAAVAAGIVVAEFRRRNKK